MRRGALSAVGGALSARGAFSACGALLGAEFTAPAAALQQQQPSARALAEPGGTAPQAIEGVWPVWMNCEGCGCEFDGMRTVGTKLFGMGVDGAPPRDVWRWF